MRDAAAAVRPHRDHIEAAFLRLCEDRRVGRAAHDLARDGRALGRLHVGEEFAHALLCFQARMVGERLADLAGPDRQVRTKIGRHLPGVQNVNAGAEPVRERKSPLESEPRRRRVVDWYEDLPGVHGGESQQHPRQHARRLIELQRALPAVSRSATARKVFRGLAPRERSSPFLRSSRSFCVPPLRERREDALKSNDLTGFNGGMRDEGRRSVRDQG